jgi:magnesium-transporting ATPase (P-type)
MSTVPEAERTQPFPTFKQARTQLTSEQARRLGGIRWGSAFFGWVTAMGMVALLSAFATAAGAASGLVTPNLDPAAVQTMGLTGALVLLAIIFVGYYCGGYVAGRMARFTGARQGVAVWLWTLFVAVLGAVIATVTGAVASLRFDEMIRLPLNGGVLSAGGAALAVGVMVVTLVGAVLGGLAGMRYHRKVDRDLVAPAGD